MARQTQQRMRKPTYPESVSPGSIRSYKSRYSSDLQRQSRENHYRSSARTSRSRQQADSQYDRRPKDRRANQKAQAAEREQELMIRLIILFLATLCLIAVCLLVVFSHRSKTVQQGSLYVSTGDGPVFTAANQGSESQDGSSEADSDMALDNANKQSEAEIYLEEHRGSIPTHYMLDVENVKQEPELPTGCESVALTMALKSLGYSLSKTEIAEKYLVYNDQNLVVGYVGDPFSKTGAGIFAPGLTATANKYLKTNGDTHKAYDITGTDFEDLFVYIAGGYPVVIWGSIDYDLPHWSSEEFNYKGKTYQWYLNEHCIMLEGYFENDGTCMIQDPISGEVEKEISKMKQIYDAIGKYALVIM